MKLRKSYILILLLMVGIAFTACKRNQDSDKSNMDSEKVKEIIDDQEINNQEYDSDKANPKGSIDESIDTGIDNYEGNIDRDNKPTDDNVIGYIRNDLISETEPIEDTTEKVKDTSEGTIAVTDNLTDANFIETIDNPKVIVKKADRILQLWDGDTLRASYPIGLGWNPSGDKEREGDGKTPEGIYYVCTRNNFSRFYLSLGLSYPNIEDADQGLEAGLIDQSTYNQIEDAISREAQPPWNTALGGEIMIHGHGSHSDWTAGCIAVDDNIMDILWEHCRMGTKVIIEP